MTYKVSVVIPAFNSEKTIFKCMESVQSQTYKELEVIVIDDGSKDYTKCIIEKYIEDNHLPWIFISRSNKGVSATRNEGIRLSTGNYIAFLDSDDCWHPNKLEKQIALIKDEHADFVSAAIVKQDTTRPFFVYKMKDLLKSNKVCTSTVVVKKEIVMEAGLFDIEMQYSEDYNLWLKITELTPLYFMTEKLVEYNTSTQGLSSKLWLMEKGELNNYKLLYRNKKIKCIDYVIYSVYSYMKYIIRFLSNRNK